MDAIDSDGFLSPEAAGNRSQCRARYSAWFDLVQRTNHLAQSLPRDIRVDLIDRPRSIACLFFIRVLGHAQGAVLLAERCMPTQSSVLVRASLEAFFGLSAVVQNAKTANRLILADRGHRRVLLESLLRQKDIPKATRTEVAALIREIDADRKKRPCRSMKTRDLAKAAGQLELYDTAYRCLSLPAHSNLRDMERHIRFDVEGVPDAILWGPQLDGLDMHLLTVCDILLRSIEAMCRLFSLDHEADLRSLRNSFKAQVALIEGSPEVRGLQ